MKYYDFYNDPKYPKPIIEDEEVIYYAYKKGIAVDCSTLATAQKISNNIERVVINKDRRAEQKKLLNIWNAECHARWKVWVKSEVPILAKYNLFEKALDHLVSIGTENDEMEDELDFISDMIKEALRNEVILQARKNNENAF
jgi:hypothetical protein